MAPTPVPDPTLLAKLNTVLANQGIIMSTLSSIQADVVALQAACASLTTTASSTAANVTGLKASLATLTANQVDPNELIALDTSLRAITQTVTDAVAKLSA